MKSQRWHDMVTIAFVASLLSAASSCGAIAANNPPDTPAPESPPFPRWLIHIDAAGVIPHPDAKISILATRVSHGSFAINNSVTMTGDVSYFPVPDMAVSLYAGLPARGVIRGSGSVSGLGALATALYGTIILSADDHATNFGAFKPYAGVGPAYTIFLDTHDAALGNVNVPNAWGVAFSVGADYAINERWTFHAYLRQIFLSATVTAHLAGVSATAKTVLNPTLFGAGFGYRF